MSHAARNAVVLLSGGLDSATALAIARADGLNCHTLAIDYGQRHRFELDAAAAVSRWAGAARHLVVKMDLRAIGGSALTDDIDVPRDRPESDMAAGIPATYVPARNLVFLSLAVGFAETIEARDVYIGVNAIDYSGYPDCRPEFIKAFEQAAALGTRAGQSNAHRINIRTPLIDLTKAEIIQHGVALGLDYAITQSCYDPDEQGRACGRCDACLLRRRGFEQADIPDPTRYAPDAPLRAQVDTHRTESQR